MAYFLRKIQTLPVNNLIILRIKNAKYFQGIVLDEPEHTMNFSNLHQCAYKISIKAEGGFLDIKTRYIDS